MVSDIQDCPHCGKPITIQVSVSLSKAKETRRSRRVRRKEKTRSDYEYAAKQQFDTAASVAMPQASTHEPAEHTATVYQRWTFSDVITDLSIAAITGILVGAIAISFCVKNKKDPWIPVFVWLGTTLIVWLLKAVDFLDFSKSIIHQIVQSYEVMMDDPEPEQETDPPAVNLTVIDPSGKQQKRATLKAPKSNHRGLFEYCAALAIESAFPSWEGGESAPGARQFGYGEKEFGESFRRPAIAVGLLEKKAGQNQGYRITEAGQASFQRIGKQRLQEASYGKR